MYFFHKIEHIPPSRHVIFQPQIKGYESAGSIITINYSSESVAKKEIGFFVATSSYSRLYDKW